jgi:catechol 2,3-dioxygenase-like lactoylglutathione lyase family enzyme
MKLVTGIGGIFFKAQNPAKLRSWYETHLGMPVESWGGLQFHWRQEEDQERRLVDPEGNHIELWEPAENEE